MKVENQEQSQESLLGQYRDLIHAAIMESESEHKTSLNAGKLQAKLKVIYKAASYDGLPETVLDQLVAQAHPKNGPKAA